MAEHSLVVSGRPPSRLTTQESRASTNLLVLFVSSSFLSFSSCADLDALLTLVTPRLCPLLNGSMPRDQDQDELANLGTINAPVAASFISTG